MTKTILTKTESPVLELSPQLSNLFHQGNGSLPVPVGRVSDLKNYEWHSEIHRKEASENLACALIAAKENMPAQVNARVTRTFMAFDEDVVEKTIVRVQELNPDAKLFAVTNSTRFPIKIEGENHDWIGQLLSEMQNLNRPDQLVPKLVMKRIHQIQNAGIEFNDGYALFWPGKAYGAPKKLILKKEWCRIQEDTKAMISLIRNAISNSARVTGQFMGSVGNHVRSTPLFANMFLLDPVLTGVIKGSLNKERYFHIELSGYAFTLYLSH